MFVSKLNHFLHEIIIFKKKKESDELWDVKHVLCKTIKYLIIVIKLIRICVRNIKLTSRYNSDDVPKSNKNTFTKDDIVRFCLIPRFEILSNSLLLRIRRRKGKVAKKWEWKWWWTAGRMREESAWDVLDVSVE